jgi:hypothetical protein
VADLEVVGGDLVPLPQPISVIAAAAAATSVGGMALPC